ncbi:SGNH/GDSL hydrolase family protein [Anaerolineales bacterium HSG24]|nr:SGNH/GDSL hydrolase family protein [Anaerolineales bacterium HSG24]
MIITYWVGYFFALFIGLGISITLLIIGRKSTWVGNITLLFLSLFVTIMGLELYFNLFYAESDSYKTLARQNWRDRYYEGTFNSFRYRDQEWTDENIAGKTKVMVVGDSFVEGFGIKYTQDRFPDLLGEKLGSDYVVFNLGKRGAGTRKEIKAMQEYPYQADILVWTYFVNDIDDLSRELDIKGPQNVPPVPENLKSWVDNSYAFNFAFWRIYRLQQSKRVDERWQWRLSAFNDPIVGEIHQQDLLSIHEMTIAQHIPMIVVVFPDLVQIEESQAIAKPIISLFETHNVPVLDVAPLLKGIAPNERIVSWVDPHPNELTHGKVAEALYQLFIDLGMSPE